MDILAHGLWTAAAAKAINDREYQNKATKKPLNVEWAVFWVVFPDLVTFRVSNQLKKLLLA